MVIESTCGERTPFKFFYYPNRTSCSLGWWLEGIANLLKGSQPTVGNESSWWNGFDENWYITRFAWFVDFLTITIILLCTLNTIIISSARVVVRDCHFWRIPSFVASLLFVRLQAQPSLFFFVLLTQDSSLPTTIVTLPNATCHLLTLRTHAPRSIRRRSVQIMPRPRQFEARPIPSPPLTVIHSSTHMISTRKLK